MLFNFKKSEVVGVLQLIQNSQCQQIERELLIIPSLLFKLSWDELLSEILKSIIITKLFH